MNNRRPSIIFPEKEEAICKISRLTQNDLYDLCNLRPVTSLARSMGNYVVQRNRTKELSKQYASMMSAVDAEYEELENQAYIHFQELTKQLEIEFENKQKRLELEYEKLVKESENQFIENKIEFDKYVRTSQPCRVIFNQLTDAAEKIAEIIEFADKEDLARNTKYYIKLGEQYRRLMRGIERISNNLA